MISALEQQIGGRHYKTLGIQPFEVTLANFGYDGLRAAVYNKVNKYLARNKGSFSDHIKDIEKAIHALQIQLEIARDEEEQKVDEAEEPCYMYGCSKCGWG